MKAVRWMAVFAAMLALAMIQVSANAESVNPDKVAVLPWVYDQGTDGARKSAGEFLSAVLLKARMEELPAARTIKMWEDGLKHKEEATRTALPKDSELLKLGQELNVEWVIAARARWHTRSLWVGFGPKTKSDCTVDLMIVDVRKQELALDAKSVKMDSTAREDTLKAVGALVLTPLFTVVSGGPKTPHEQRAVQLATAKALEPWLEARVPKSHKIGSDDK